MLKREGACGDVVVGYTAKKTDFRSCLVATERGEEGESTWEGPVGHV